jgi:4-hydroxybenzoate polyprenyltransferase
METAAPSTLRQLAAASRLHIVLIAGLATMTFGWLFGGRFAPLIALWVALDWWVLDVGNKLSDLAEDLRNAPTEARWVQHNRNALGLAAVAVFAGSLVATLLHDDWILAALRVGFQLVGVGYNFRVIPLEVRGRAGTRFKDLYAAKNGVAGALFVLSVILYPVVGRRGALLVPPVYILLMVGFFFFFEMSFEVIYDLKDIAGDQAEGIPTFPAVHGAKAGVAVAAGFALAGAGFISGGYLAGVFGFREIIILLAPGLQLLVLPIYRRRGFRARDTVWITHLGSLQLAVYNLYVWLGLPIPPW